MLRFILSGAILVAGAGAATAQAPGPYTIDVIVSLTGSAAFAGKNEADAIRLYEGVANRQGGIRGRPVHFQIFDDQSLPALTIQLATGMLAKHPAVVLGCTFAPGCSAIAPLFANGPAVLYAFSPGFTPPGGGYVFLPIYSIEHGVGAQVRFFAERGLTRLAVISGTDASGQGNDRATDDVVKRLENRNVRIVAYEHFNPTDLSVAAQVARIKAAAPQALLVWANGTPFGTVLHGLADAGLDLPIGTSAANMVAEQLAGYGSVLPRELIFGGQSFLNADRPRGDPLKEPVDELTSAFANAGIKPTVVAGLAWDPAKIVVAALRRLGPDATGAQLHAYLENLHGFAGAGGIYDFRSGDQHGLTQAAVVLVRWDAPRGTYVVVSRQGGAPLPSAGGR
jgi:branched-chain amino acid transport system substrate-binding protein